MDFEKKHQEDLQRLRGFRLLDDDFMTKVFEDIQCAELLLRIILNDEGIHVLEVHSQRGIKNLQGRSVRLDILAIDSHDRVFNVEVQRSDKGAGAKRARYNSALIDANVTEPGDLYEALNETFVIFITENDVMKADLPIYHIDRVVKETGKLFKDEAHIIYVNSQIKNETKLGRLMHDFSCTNAKDMHNKVLADRVRYFKEDERGVADTSNVPKPTNCTFSPLTNSAAITSVKAFSAFSASFLESSACSATAAINSVLFICFISS